MEREAKKSKIDKAKNTRIKVSTIPLKKLPVSVNSVSERIILIPNSGFHTKICIAETDINTGNTSILAGGEIGYKDGVGVDAKFGNQLYYAKDILNNVLYISDTMNRVIRVLNLEEKSVTTLCGSSGIKGNDDGIGNKATFQQPTGIAFDSTNRILYVADCYTTQYGKYHIIRRVFVDKASVETLPNEIQSSSRFFEVALLCFKSSTRDLYIGTGTGIVKQSMDTNSLTQIHGYITTYNICGMAIDEKRNCLYISEPSNGEIRKVDMSGEAVIVSTLCGRYVSSPFSTSEIRSIDGDRDQACFDNVARLTFCSNSNNLIVGDSIHKVRRISIQNSL